MWHTATAIAVSSSQVVVVVFGGLDELIDDLDFFQQPMKSPTVLEFGNYVLYRAGGRKERMVRPKKMRVRSVREF